MTLEYFLLLLMIVSIFTGLVTEGIKKLLEESKKTYKANFLAGGVAVVLSVLVGSGYIILMDAQINSKMAVYLIALILLSWLSAMVGYDKVIHAREPRNLATQSRLLQQSTKKRGNSLSFCHKVLCCIKIFCIFLKLLHHMKSASLKFISIKS